MQITIDDPKAYTKPWDVTLPLVFQPDTEMIEYMCTENEKDLKHLVGKVERPLQGRGRYLGKCAEDFSFSAQTNSISSVSSMRRWSILTVHGLRVRLRIVDRDLDFQASVVHAPEPLGPLSRHRSTGCR